VPGKLRVTVVHDYLTGRGGAERVTLAMMRAFPGATLLTSTYDPEATFPEFSRYDVRAALPIRLTKDPRKLLPLLPAVFDSLQPPPSDVVICSSSGWAHGVKTCLPKIVYCHNPPRWLYQTSEYAAEQRLPVRLALEVLRNRLTRWDKAAAEKATLYLANSHTVRQRIMMTYGRDADVLPPPVAIDVTGPRAPVPGLRPGFLLNVSRDRGYKHTTRLTEAMRLLPGERLVIVGGPARSEDDSRTTRLPAVPDDQLRWLYANCSALVAVGHDDFGLTPVEANAFGRPAACLRAGGYLDSLAPGVSGVFIESLTPQGIADGVSRLRATPFHPRRITAHADRYSEATFAAELRGLAEKVTGHRPSIIPLPRAEAQGLRATPAAIPLNEGSAGTSSGQSGRHSSSQTRPGSTSSQPAKRAATSSRVRCTVGSADER
jgi:glycosyltransferase involved in cell wall biosynthesis